MLELRKLVMRNPSSDKILCILGHASTSLSWSRNRHVEMHSKQGLSAEILVKLEDNAYTYFS